MIILLANSNDKNTELKNLALFMKLPCVFVNLYEKESTQVYTPWNYYSNGGPDDSGKPMFWLDLTAQSDWSFRGGDIRKGQIFDGDEHLANVYFREPFEDQCIDQIEWFRNGEVYARDCYNSSGIKYAETVVNNGTDIIVKYPGPNGLPAVVEWSDLGFVTVKKDGQENLYENQEQFYAAFLKDFLAEHSEETVLFYEPELLRYIPEGMRCVLFVLDDVCRELNEPGVRKSLSVIVAGRPWISHSLTSAIKEGEIPKIIEIGYLVDRSVGHSVQNALIVTRSQNIEHLQSLVEGLPELHFHIAAGTMMAPDLMAFDRYPNVTLYPNSPRNRILQLMHECAFYLDINHYLEYEGIVSAALRMDRLVYAFDNTAHQRSCIPDDHIYMKEEADQMVSDISRAMYDPNWLEESLSVQRSVIGITDEQIDELKKIFSSI